MLNISIYSLTGTAFHENGAEVVVVPGINGDIGINPGDRVLTYLLRPGIIYFLKEGKSFKRLFIFNGRFMAENNTVTITTEHEVIDLGSITEVEINKKITAAKEKVALSSTDFEKDFYNEQLEKTKILSSLQNENLY